MATYTPPQNPAPTPLPTPAPVPKAPGLVPTVLQNTTGAKSVWAGDTLSDAQTQDAQHWLKTKYGEEVFGADGKYDASNDQRNREVLGAAQAMGLSMTDLSDKVLGGSVTPEQIEALRASDPEAVRTQEQGFMREEPRLFPTKPVVPQAPYTEMQQQYAPELARTIDASKETIEGRLNNVLGRDAAGNYTNDVVRQAVERAQQQFAKRGLVNTSMAAQAGQEAAIAKAIEIVGPDAERYFQQGRANQDAKNVFARDETQQAYTERNNNEQWNRDAGMQSQRIQNEQYLAELDKQFRDRMLTKEQAFNLRQNYVTAQDRVSQSYQRMVDTINTSQMTPEDKTAAIANAAQIRDSESAYINSVFSKQPEWQSDWLALSVQLGAADIATMEDVNALATIANDPAQPAATREQARARLAQLQANPTPEPTPTPAPSGLVDFAGSGA